MEVSPINEKIIYIMVEDHLAPDNTDSHNAIRGFQVRIWRYE